MPVSYCTSQSTFAITMSPMIASIRALKVNYICKVTKKCGPLGCLRLLQFISKHVSVVSEENKKEIVPVTSSSFTI